MKKLFRISILGTSYTFYSSKREESDDLEDCDGYTDTISKKIFIAENADCKNETIVHEIVHAFLYESGLDIESWASNEEIVDWIALQLDKVSKVSMKALRKFNRKRNQ